MSGENAPICTPGNAGFVEGASAPPESDAFTVASRYVYEPPTRTYLPIIPSTDSSAPRASNDCELTYAPKPVAAAAAADTPSCGSTRLLTNSMRLSYELSKYVARTRARPCARLCSMPTSRLRARSGPIGPTPGTFFASANSDDSSWKIAGALMPFPALKVSFVSPAAEVADGLRR